MRDHKLFSLKILGYLSRKNNPSFKVRKRNKTKDVDKPMLKGVIVNPWLSYFQGVVFLLDPTKQRNPGDTMVLTVRPIDHQDTVVAGAKIPMSKVSFPFRFSMSEKNILPGKADQTDADLVIRVTVCPQESGPQCSDDESDLKGVGLAKLIRNFPETSQEVGAVRLGASIGLGSDT